MTHIFVFCCGHEGGITRLGGVNHKCKIAIKKIEIGNKKYRHVLVFTKLTPSDNNKQVIKKMNEMVVK
jgi:hypothetical protein